MMPEEVHEVIAKILLCVFATFALCFMRARASEVPLELKEASFARIYLVN